MGKNSPLGYLLEVRKVIPWLYNYGAWQDRETEILEEISKEDDWQPQILLNDLNELDSYWSATLEYLRIFKTEQRNKLEVEFKKGNSDLKISNFKLIQSPRSIFFYKNPTLAKNYTKEYKLTSPNISNNLIYLIYTRGPIRVNYLSWSPVNGESENENNRKFENEIVSMVLNRSIINFHLISG